MKIFIIMILFSISNVFAQKTMDDELKLEEVGERISELEVKKTLGGIIASAGVPKDFSYKGVDIIYAYDKIKEYSGSSIDDYKIKKKDILAQYKKGKLNLLFHIFQLMDLREFGLGSPYQWAEIVNRISPSVKEVLSNKETDNNTYVDTLLLFPLRDEFFVGKNSKESDDNVLEYIGGLYKKGILSKSKLKYLEDKMTRISGWGKLLTKNVYLMKGALLLKYLSTQGYKSNIDYKQWIPKEYPFRY